MRPDIKEFANQPRSHASVTIYWLWLIGFEPTLHAERVMKSNIRKLPEKMSRNFHLTHILARIRDEIGTKVVPPHQLFYTQTAHSTHNQIRHRLEFVFDFVDFIKWLRDTRWVTAVVVATGDSRIKTLSFEIST